jgi:hypothetical protein
MPKKRRFKRQRKDSFTLIENMIVLAIIAVMISAIFFAVPALRRMHRDSTRKNFSQDLVSSEGEFYATYHRVPGCDVSCTAQDVTNVRNFIANYFPGIDPINNVPYSSEALTVNTGIDIRTPNDSVIYMYNARNVDHTVSPAFPDQIIVATGHWCYASAPDGLNTILAGTDSEVQKFAILIGTEKGGYYCLDNY